MMMMMMSVVVILHVTHSITSVHYLPDCEINLNVEQKKQNVGKRQNFVSCIYVLVCTDVCEHVCMRLCTCACAHLCTIMY